MWGSCLLLPSVAFWNSSMVSYWLSATPSCLRGVGMTSSMRAFICHAHICLVGAATKDPESPKQPWERRVASLKQPSERSLRNQAPWFQMTLQSYGHQTGMVLAWKQTHRPVEQKSELRNTARCIRSIHVWQRRQGKIVTEHHQVRVPNPQQGQTILKHWSLEQRKVYYKAMQGDGRLMPYKPQCYWKLSSKPS